MKRLYESLFVIISASTVSLSASAGTGGSNPVISDSAFDTAVGTDALFSLTSGGWTQLRGKTRCSRPVTFKLENDAQGSGQYGLIPEEVAKVYPELVIRDRSGRIDGVRYDDLAPMLLDELQQLKKQVADLTRANRSMQAAMLELNSRDARLTMQ